MTAFTAISLEDFVQRSDELGGPGSPACQAFWNDFSYTPTAIVDQSLDPFSEDYVQAQLDLHREITGRDFDQAVNELTNFDFNEHVNAPNPYKNITPSELSLHMLRLSKAIRCADLPAGSHLLDMGCGWGLSSEVAAYLGLRVTAVDINPRFVNLVNARAARSGLKIRATQSDFDNYRPVEPTAAILFYECFHHAVRPWTVLQAVIETLDYPSGTLLLAGEPVNDTWWTHWGLRLDPMSVYCMRKFGWFESGWSLSFLEETFRRCGLDMVVHSDPDLDIGQCIVGRRVPVHRIAAAQLVSTTSSEGFVLERDTAVLTGEGVLELRFPGETQRAYVEISNHRGSPVMLTASTGDLIHFSGAVRPGLSTVLIENSSPEVRVELSGETWNPAETFGSSDNRLISLHLEAIAFF